MKEIEESRKRQGVGSDRREGSARPAIFRACEQRRGKNRRSLLDGLRARGRSISRRLPKRKADVPKRAEGGEHEDEDEERKRKRDESEVGRQIRNRHHIENHNSWDWGLQVRQGRTVTAICIASQ